MTAVANRKQSQGIASNFIRGAKCFDFLCVGSGETSRGAEVTNSLFNRETVLSAISASERWKYVLAVGCISSAGRLPDPLNTHPAFPLTLMQHRRATSCLSPLLSLPSNVRLRRPDKSPLSPAAELHCQLVTGRRHADFSALTANRSDSS